MSQDPWWPPAVNGIPVPYGASIEDLGRMLTTSETAAVAATALAREGSSESLELLIPLLHNNGPDWQRRRIGVEAVGRHPLGGREAPRVLELLDDTVPEVVWYASIAAASLGLTEAVPHLIASLGSPYNLVSSGAHNALYELRQPGDIVPLIAMYRTCDYEARKSIVWLIMARVRPAIWREVFDLFKATNVDGHREIAARLAHEFAGSDVLPDLEVLAQDHDGHVRGAARRAIGAIHSRGGIGGFGDYDPELPISTPKLGRSIRQRP